MYHKQLQQPPKVLQRGPHHSELVSHWHMRHMESSKEYVSYLLDADVPVLMLMVPHSDTYCNCYISIKLVFIFYTFLDFCPNTSHLQSDIAVQKLFLRVHFTSLTVWQEKILSKFFRPTCIFSQFFYDLKTVQKY